MVQQVRNLDMGWYFRNPSMGGALETWHGVVPSVFKPPPNMAEVPLVLIRKHYFYLSSRLGYFWVMLRPWFSTWIATLCGVERPLRRGGLKPFENTDTHIMICNSYRIAVTK